MLKVGLTGGIASGKTHVLRGLAEAGFHTLDLDAVSRDVMAPGGTAYRDVVDAFGPAIVGEGGAIDRKALGARVFADESARRRLESFVHPRIRQSEALHLAAAAAGEVAVVDAALLVESGQHLRFARLVVVHCEPEEQLRRLMARDGLAEPAARARLQAQMPPGEKRRFGHLVIDTSGTLAGTDRQVDAVVATLRALASDETPKPAIPAERAVSAMAVGPSRGPRGLHPWRVVEEIAASGDLDMARMAALIDRPTGEPWYRMAMSGASGQEAPETLALPVAMWAGGRRPGDEPFAIAAAATMARLTHTDPAGLSGAVLAVLAALHFLTTGSAADMRARVADWRAAAAAWTGAPPPSSTMVTILAAAAHAGDGEAAAREAGGKGGVADLASALSGASPAAVATSTDPARADTAAVDPARKAQVARILAPRVA